MARPSELCAYLAPQDAGACRSDLSRLITAAGGAQPDITILRSAERVPWAGHSSRYALPDIYQTLRDHRMALIFVNTRSQAEMLFHELWHLNEDNLPIALPHGSLDVAQRRKVEAAMVAGKLRAVVATSTPSASRGWRSETSSMK